MVREAVVLTQHHNISTKLDHMQKTVSVVDWVVTYTIHLLQKR